MTENRRSISTVLRFLAALALVIGAFVFFDATPLAARYGTCAEASGAICISSAGNVYEGKMCEGTQCMTCQPQAGSICTGYGTDVNNAYDSDKIKP